LYPHTVSEITDPHNILGSLLDGIIGSAPRAGFAPRVMWIEWFGRTKNSIRARDRRGVKGV
jgi:hypothetical protein